jgi:hypothetical protein
MRPWDNRSESVNNLSLKEKVSLERNRSESVNNIIWKETPFFGARFIKSACMILNTNFVYTFELSFTYSIVTKLRFYAKLYL